MTVYVIEACDAFHGIEIDALFHLRNNKYMVKR